MEIKETSRQHRLVSNSKRKRCSSLSFSLKGAEFESDVFISWGKAGLPAPHPDFLPATSGLFLHILSMQGTALSFDVNVCLSQACHRDQREWVFEVREVKSENKVTTR